MAEGVYTWFVTKLYIVSYFALILSIPQKRKKPTKVLEDSIPASIKELIESGFNHLDPIEILANISTFSQNQNISRAEREYLLEKFHKKFNFSKEETEKILIDFDSNCYRKGITYNPNDRNIIDR